ncbi:sugar phosphate isomerase/epimerase family protein [Lacrimispora celerecrescens]|uniref:Sugar phosphate isomerase/epimerase n=1 Tax=[Clostridium] celerecrescens 18A TaxID=1286362 RepID=A0A2M8ZCG1_9FIRM|nr:sugar phosphate isomerase/epimerase [Lacrimispora celerecrescens]PJJ31126.1 sugar phosphate isomerase/epimerase [[Clostridium] celerecrescens 18A]
MLEIGVQSRGIIRESVIEVGYKKIKQAGITCVDYNIVSPEDSTEKLEVSYFRKHKECATRHGIRFSQVHAPILKYELNRPDKMEYILEEMKKSIAICSILGSPFLVMHPLELAFELGGAKEKKNNLEYFGSLTEDARRHDVIICIENMPYRRAGRVWGGACSEARKTVEYIDILNKEAGEQRFGACFDVGHANVLGKNLREEVRALGSHLKVLHIHDNDGVADSHQLPYSFSDATTGLCTTDWSGFLLGLREISFEGVLSFETYRSFTSFPGVLQESLLQFLYRIGVNFSHVICFNQLLDQMGSKKKILFGAGRMFDVYMGEYGKKHPPVFAVDNNACIWGTEKLGIPICNPETLLEVPEDERIVILCNAYYEEIAKQLNDMGINHYELTEEIIRMSGKPI